MPYRSNFSLMHLKAFKMAFSFFPKALREITLLASRAASIYQNKHTTKLCVEERSAVLSVGLLCMSYSSTFEKKKKQQNKCIRMEMGLLLVMPYRYRIIALAVLLFVYYLFFSRRRITTT